jgi:CxxH/CxxC protein (TIGR04129 family)
VYVACKEHVDYAIDYFVDEYEEAPDIVLLAETSFTDWEAPACCHFCQQTPVFLIV